MTYVSLLATSVALGLFVLAGGAYGVLYAVSVARSNSSLERASYLCYVAQLLLVLVVCLGSPLDWLWKLFIAASGVAYGFIPPVTWRLLETMHHSRAK